MAEMKQATPRIFGLRRLDDRIAIHYSQASIRAHWMFDSRQDGNTWPRRFSSFEATHSPIARVRDSFMRVVEDLVLLLPQSVAMSAAECRRVEEFVHAGGTVIADNMTATMDEHGHRLARGQLDDLFGIERSGVGWRAQPAGGALGELAAFEPDIAATTGTAQRQSDSGVPALILNQVGGGHAVYLNIDMHDYGRLRLDPPGGEGFRKLFGQLVADAGVSDACRPPPSRRIRPGASGAACNSSTPLINVTRDRPQARLTREIPP
jgi:Beta-galactosidase trimerisation domain